MEGIFARKQRAFEALGVPRENSLSLSLSPFFRKKKGKKNVERRDLQDREARVKNDGAPIYSESRSKGTIKAARKFFYFLGNDFRAGGLSLSASCGSFAEKLVGAGHFYREQVPRK